MLVVDWGDGCNGWHEIDRRIFWKLILYMALNPGREILFSHPFLSCPRI